jgi:hypothetical protein
MHSSRWNLAAIAACLVVASSVTAEAQVCGDADNSGAVTVTDGVQVLRAAAGLSSTCDTNSNCDVDGNGSVSVTDGVNVLRKAADLPISEACAAGTNTEVASLLKQAVPVFGGFGQLTKLGSASANAAAAPCENDDGSASFNETDNDFEFDNCRLGDVTFDGFIAVSGNTLFFDLDITDDLDGDIEFFTDTGLTFEQSGDNVILSGQLGLTDFSGDLGDFSATFEGLVTDPNGNSIGGSVLFDASESDIEGLAAIRIGFDGTSTVQPVDLILTDQSVQHFNFDSVSGTLTPVSG